MAGEARLPGSNANEALLVESPGRRVAARGKLGGLLRHPETLAAGHHRLGVVDEDERRRRAELDELLSIADLPIPFERNEK